MKEITIHLATQSLTLYQDGKEYRRYAVSTAANGGGEENGSFKTPRGCHIIRVKIGGAAAQIGGAVAQIGGGAAVNTVFVGRRPSGEIYTPQLSGTNPGRDWILTRILWLSGCEIGKNRLGSVDTMRRYIYLHGTPDTTPLGKPGSIGCIRMNNADVMDLFEQVSVGTPVNIIE